MGDDLTPAEARSLADAVHGVRRDEGNAWDDDSRDARVTEAAVMRSLKEGTPEEQAEAEERQATKDLADKIMRGW